jgi:hypothetical protein
VKNHCCGSDPDSIRFNPYWEKSHSSFKIHVQKSRIFSLVGSRVLVDTGIGSSSCKFENSLFLFKKLDLGLQIQIRSVVLQFLVIKTLDPDWEPDPDSLTMLGPD